jgi:uncharacterized phage protein (TIGR01671 family)
METTELEFRGKRIDNGEWIYGYLTVHFSASSGYDEKSPHIEFFKSDHFETWEVDPKTVGQYTGVRDSADSRIYVGNIVRWEEEPEAIFVVKFGKYCTEQTEEEVAENWHCGFYLSPIEPDQENWGLTGSEFEDYHFEIIGNVFENQELLKTE